MTKPMLEFRGTCQACRHFAKPDPGEDMGGCRVHAPVIQFFMIPVQNALTRQPEPRPIPVSGWPLVQGGQWCGEFAGRLS